MVRRPAESAVDPHAHQSSSRQRHPRSLKLIARRNRSPCLRLVQFLTFFFKCPNRFGFVLLHPRMRRQSPGIARVCSKTWVRYLPTYLKHFALNRAIAFMMRSRGVSISAGWLAPRMIQILSSAARAFICSELCRTLSVGPLWPRVATVSSSMYLPNRNGEGEVSLRCCFDKSSNGREQSAWIALSFTLRKKAERSTNDSDSLQAMRCDSPAIRFYRAARLRAAASARDQPRTIFIPCRMIRSINCGYGSPALRAESAKSSSSARMGFGFASMK